MTQVLTDTEIDELLAGMKQFEPLKVGHTAGSHRSFVTVDGPLGLEANCGVDSDRNRAKAEFFVAAPALIRQLRSERDHYRTERDRQSAFANTNYTALQLACDERDKARAEVIEKIQQAIKLIHSDESEGGDYHAGMAILCEIAGYEFPAHKALQSVKPITIYDAMKSAAKEGE